MFGWFAGKSAMEIVKKLWPVWLALLFGIIILLAYCQGKGVGQTEADNQRLEGNAKTLENTSRANENAATARGEDQTRLQQEQTELQKATNNANSPAERRRAFHRCLRDQQTARAAGRPAPVCQ